LLEVRNIETLYGLIMAIRGVSLEVKEGQIAALLGANGAGKTTILKTILGLLEDQPDKGTVHFLGKRIDRKDTEEIVRLGISYVPEGREVFPELNVDENLRMGAYIRKDKRSIKEDYDRVISHFPVLAERMHQWAGTLSGGEQQMLVICRSLMSNPELLILDEPSLGLAPIIVEKVLDTLRKINEDGVTILLVEQNIRDSLNIANRAYVLEEGKIIIEGEGRELLSNDHIKEVYLGA